jgi:hypothetical protein
MYRYSSSRSPLAALAAAMGIVTVALAATSGCHERSSPTEPSHVQTATLAVGQTVTIATGMVLSFERVLSDSRCPSGVTCVWEGEVTVALTLSESVGTGAFTLSDHAPTRVVSGYSFTLVSVQPLPTAGSTIPEAAYRATIRVRRSVY